MKSIVLLGYALTASSHADAPATATDPAADVADFYVFRSPDSLNTVTLVATVWPFEEAGAGPSFPSFGDDVRYNLKVDSNGDAREDLVYEVTFRTERTAGDQTFQYARRIDSIQPPDFSWYVRQYANVTLFEVESGRRTQVLRDGVVAPHNLGGATPGYGTLVAPAIHDVMIPDPGGGAGRIFCGPRDDPFFADLGALSDDLGIRAPPGDAGGGADYVAGWNVLAIVIQVPITSVTVNRNLPANPRTQESMIGAWATAERRKITVRSTAGSRRGHGQWVQVSRAGFPLLSTLFVPSGLKDGFNASHPRADSAGRLFMMDLRAPVIASELERVYPNMYMAPPPPRDDLTGVLAANLQFGQSAAETRHLVEPADILRLDVAVSASPLDGSNNRLGLLAQSPGFPNGRRLDDDAVDIVLRIASGVLLGGPFATRMNAAIGDGVDRNDLPFANVFPYLPPPRAASAARR